MKANANALGHRQSLTWGLPALPSLNLSPPCLPIPLPPASTSRHGGCLPPLTFWICFIIRRNTSKIPLPLFSSWLEVQLTIDLFSPCTYESLLHTCTHKDTHSHMHTNVNWKKKTGAFLSFTEALYCNKDGRDSHWRINMWKVLSKCLWVVSWKEGNSMGEKKRNEHRAIWAHSLHCTAKCS